MFTLAESLGGVESLIEHPGRMTHASVAGTALEVPSRPDPAQRRPGGREDLIADLDQALRWLADRPPRPTGLLLVRPDSGAPFSAAAVINRCSSLP